MKDDEVPLTKSEQEVEKKEQALEEQRESFSEVECRASDSASSCMLDELPISAVWEAELLEFCQWSLPGFEQWTGSRIYVPVPCLRWTHSGIDNRMIFKQSATFFALHQ